jgi:hypothetical protein
LSSSSSGRWGRTRSDGSSARAISALSLSCTCRCPTHGDSLCDQNAFGGQPKPLRAMFTPRSNCEGHPHGKPPWQVAQVVAVAGLAGRNAGLASDATNGLLHGSHPLPEIKVHGKDMSDRARRRLEVGTGPQPGRVDDRVMSTTPWLCAPSRRRRSPQVELDHTQFRSG